MLNRRMPNGTYGGVRGGLNSPYSIFANAGQQHQHFHPPADRNHAMMKEQRYDLDK